MVSKGKINYNKLIHEVKNEMKYELSEEGSHEPIEKLYREIVRQTTPCNGRQMIVGFCAMEEIDGGTFSSVITPNVHSVDGMEKYKEDSSMVSYRLKTSLKGYTIKSMITLGSNSEDSEQDLKLGIAAILQYAKDNILE